MERIRFYRIILFVGQEKERYKTNGNIIDRSDEKIRSSPAYNQWASVHNLKAMAETHNYLAEHHDYDLAEFERLYADCIARRDAANIEFDEAAKQIAANNSIGIGERLKRHNDLKTRHAKEMAALNTELAEMERVRKNLTDVLGEDFYSKNSRRGKEVAL